MMFPPMIPMGERIRTEVELREIMRRNEVMAETEPGWLWAWTRRLPRPAQISAGIRGFVAALNLRPAAKGRVITQEVDCNPC